VVVTGRDVESSSESNWTRGLMKSRVVRGGAGDGGDGASATGVFLLWNWMYDAEKTSHVANWTERGVGVRRMAEGCLMDVMGNFGTWPGPGSIRL
jgi:hypothetical protein